MHREWAGLTSVVVEQLPGLMNELSCTAEVRALVVTAAAMLTKTIGGEEGHVEGDRYARGFDHAQRIETKPPLGGAVGSV